MKREMLQLYLYNTYIIYMREIYAIKRKKDNQQEIALYTKSHTEGRNKKGYVVKWETNIPFHFSLLYGVVFCLLCLLWSEIIINQNSHKEKEGIKEEKRDVTNEWNIP